MSRPPDYQPHVVRVRPPGVPDRVLFATTYAGAVETARAALLGAGGSAAVGRVDAARPRPPKRSDPRPPAPPAALPNGARMSPYKQTLLEYAAWVGLIAAGSAGLQGYVSWQAARPYTPDWTADLAAHLPSAGFTAALAAAMYALMAALATATHFRLVPRAASDGEVPQAVVDRYDTPTTFPPGVRDAVAETQLRLQMAQTGILTRTEATARSVTGDAAADLAAGRRVRLVIPDLGAAGWLTQVGGRIVLADVERTAPPTTPGPDKSRVVARLRTICPSGPDIDLLAGASEPFSCPDLNIRGNLTHSPGGIVYLHVRRLASPPETADALLARLGVTEAEIAQFQTRLDKLEEDVAAATTAEEDAEAAEVKVRETLIGVRKELLGAREELTEAQATIDLMHDNLDRTAAARGVAEEECRQLKVTLEAARVSHARAVRDAAAGPLTLCVSAGAETAWLGPYTGTTWDVDPAVHGLRVKARRAGDTVWVEVLPPAPAAKPAEVAPAATPPAGPVYDNPEDLKYDEWVEVVFASATPTVVGPYRGRIPAFGLHRVLATTASPSGAGSAKLRVGDTYSFPESRAHDRWRRVPTGGPAPVSPPPPPAPEPTVTPAYPCPTDVVPGDVLEFAGRPPADGYRTWSGRVTAWVPQRGQTDVAVVVLTTSPSGRRAGEPVCLHLFDDPATRPVVWRRVGEPLPAVPPPTAEPVFDCPTAVKPGAVVEFRAAPPPAGQAYTPWTGVVETWAVDAAGDIDVRLTTVTQSHGRVPPGGTTTMTLRTKPGRAIVWRVVPPPPPVYDCPLDVGVGDEVEFASAGAGTTYKPWTGVVTRVVPDPRMPASIDLTVTVRAADPADRVHLVGRTYTLSVWIEAKNRPVVWRVLERAPVIPPGVPKSATSDGAVDVLNEWCKLHASK